jgi:LmbE family N-acetylglucosaminyl deacetylase
VDAVYPTARDRLNFPEHLQQGLPTHKVRELYLWGTNSPNYHADISAVVEQKIQALVAHTSQFPADDDFIQQIRSLWEDGDGHYVESFKRVVLFR